MNKWIGLGNIGKDVDVRTNGDSTVARFSLAVKRKFAREGETDTDWLNIICFGKQAEFAEKYLKKGTKIIVEGRVATGSYTNKDGNRVNTFDIVAENIEFAESKKASESNTKEETKASDEGFADVPSDIDSDLPFD